MKVVFDVKRVLKEIANVHGQRMIRIHPKELFQSSGTWHVKFGAGEIVDGQPTSEVVGSRNKVGVGLARQVENVIES